MTILTAGGAAKLIQEATGKSCTRQTIESHVRSGKLPKSTAQLYPVRIKSDFIVQEYLANIQQKSHNPPDPEKLKALEPDGSVPDSLMKEAISTLSADERVRVLRQKLPESTRTIPHGMSGVGGFDINQAKAWKEMEAARRLQIQRLADEGAYVEAAGIESEWEKALVVINRSVMAIPSRLKADRPDTPLSTIDLVRDLCREALEKASAALEDGTY